MKSQSVFGFFLSILMVAVASAVDYRVEPLDEAPPVDELSAEIASQLSPHGLRVIRGTKRAYCDIWLLKQWEIPASFEPTAEIIYPFRPGQLVGVARFSRKGADFRGQDIARGVYTMRYAHQPVDGSHIGTSPTRDFLLLLRADADKSAKGLGTEDLIANSAAAAASSHPCMLCLQRVSEHAGKFPSMRHYEEFDWWIVGLQGQVKAGAETKKLAMELVIAGAAIE